MGSEPGISAGCVLRRALWGDVAAAVECHGPANVQQPWAGVCLPADMQVSLCRPWPTEQRGTKHSVLTALQLHDAMLGPW